MLNVCLALLRSRKWARPGLIAVEFFLGKLPKTGYLKQSATRINFVAEKIIMHTLERGGDENKTVCCFHSYIFVYLFCFLSCLLGKATSQLTI